MFSSFLHDLPKRSLVVLAPLVILWSLYIYFRTPVPSNHDIAIALDNAVGIDTARCNGLTITPHNHGYTAPGIPAEICSFLNRKTNKIESGIFIKSNTTSQWLALSPPAEDISSLPSPITPTRRNSEDNDALPSPMVVHPERLPHPLIQRHPTSSSAEEPSHPTRPPLVSPSIHNQDQDSDQSPKLPQTHDDTDEIETSPTVVN